MFVDKDDEDEEEVRGHAEETNGAQEDSADSVLLRVREWESPSDWSCTRQGLIFSKGPFW